MRDVAIDAVDGFATGTTVPKRWGLFKAPTDSEELPMQAITAIGLDFAKSVFQVHGVDADAVQGFLTDVSCFPNADVKAFAIMGWPRRR